MKEIFEKIKIEHLNLIVYLALLFVQKSIDYISINLNIKKWCLVSSIFSFKKKLYKCIISESDEIYYFKWQQYKSYCVLQRLILSKFDLVVDCFEI